MNENQKETSIAPISVKDLVVEYGSNPVVKDATFDVTKGAITYIVGRNGSGKSTLVSAILGLIPVKSGEVYLYGQPRTQEKVSDLFGYMPQYSHIDRTFPITVAEMIELECTHSKSCPLGVEGHLERLGGGYLSEKPIRALSGGELQKVLLARALVTEPEVLVLDEPMNNLDHKSQDKLHEMIHEMNESGTTILIVTHDYSFIDEQSEEVLLIDDGKVYKGRLSQLFKEMGVRYEHR